MPAIALRVLLIFPFLFFFCLFVPGYFLVRRWPLSPAEKVACSVGTSIFLIYLYSFLIYIARLPVDRHFAFTGAGILIALLYLKELRLFLPQPEIRQLFVRFTILFIWATALLGMIRNYSGGNWVHDWYEHYHRTIFFLHRLPLDTVFSGEYELPARPPLFNLVSAHFLAQLGDSYAIYQVTAMLLNLTVFFPADLFFRKLLPDQRASLLTLSILLAANPSIMENTTYSWTKLLTAFYVLVGIWFYLKSLHDFGPFSTGLAFGNLAVGLLVHYSAGPYIVLLSAHYLWRQLRVRRIRWKEIAGLSALAALLLSTWFGWSILHYGLSGTFGSITYVTDAAGFSFLGNLRKIARNIFDSVVPWFWRWPDLGTEGRLAYLVDYCFRLYQTNLFLAVGSVGWLIAALQARKLVYQARADRILLWFWFWLVAGVVVLGIAVMGKREPWGLAHMSLQPLIVLGVVLVAAAWHTCSRFLRVATVAGVSFDFAVGVALHFADQHRCCSRFGSAAGYINYDVKKTYHLLFLGDYWTLAAFGAQATLLCSLIYFTYVSKKQYLQLSADAGP